MPSPVAPSCARSCSSRSCSRRSSSPAPNSRSASTAASAILAAHVFFNVAVIVRVVGSYWARLDPRLWDGAATHFGAGVAARFRHVTLPLLAPALAASGTLVFLFCFTSFGVILILGGPTYATLETEIYNAAARLDLRTAAVLARPARRCRGDPRPLEPVRARPAAERAARERRRTDCGRPAGGERWVVAAVLALSGLALGLPLAGTRRALARRARRSTGSSSIASSGARRRCSSSSRGGAITGSLLFATAATALALAVGGLAAVAVARRRAGWLDVLVMLPLGASAVMLGFGFVIAFDDPPLDLRGSPWLVPIAQSLVAAPFVVRIVAPALR